MLRYIHSVARHEIVLVPELKANKRWAGSGLRHSVILA